MRITTFNVNGLRAVLNKGFSEFFERENADVFCLQEIKCLEGQAEFTAPGYTQIWNSAEKKGYSGTLTLSKQKPLSVAFGADGRHLDEGRLITAEYRDFFIVNCYTPNAQPELKRIGYRLEFERDLRAYLCKLDKTKPVILCGDLNVAHEEIDLKHPKENRGSAGFSDEERGAMTELLSCGFSDSFRALYPDKTDAYTWWSYRARARENNVGWRIDYFIVSDSLMDRVESVEILSGVFGSDHCPLRLTVNL